MDNTAEEFDNLVNSTNVSGSTSGTDFGPYLQKAPVNPFTNASSCRSDNTGDWQYTASDGSILAVVPAAVFAERVALGIDGDVVSQ